MGPTVYIETTIISYLAARKSENVLVAAHQAITVAWWETRCADFDLFCSQLVVVEAARGDADAAARRLGYLGDIPQLEVTTECQLLARALLAEAGLPAKAGADALHIAGASIHAMDYLLTWNCAHIANAEIRRKVEQACLSRDIDPPIICTPEELLGFSNANP